VAGSGSPLAGPAAQKRAGQFRAIGGTGVQLIQHMQLTPLTWVRFHQLLKSTVNNRTATATYESSGAPSDALGAWYSSLVASTDLMRPTQGSRPAAVELPVLLGLGGHGGQMVASASTTAADIGNSSHRWQSDSSPPWVVTTAYGSSKWQQPPCLQVPAITRHRLSDLRG
jgi:hypothetical protein